MFAAVVAVEAVRRILQSRLIGEKWVLAGPLVRRCTWPGFAAAAVATAYTVYEPGMADRSVSGTIQRVLSLLMIGCVTWLVIQAAYAVTDVVLERLISVEGERNRKARRIRTQITLVRRVASAVIIVVALGAMLFTFPQVRALGAGLLASAGIAGVVVGIAAQATLGNMLAGLQLAFSDALRLDDVVVVKGEWGRIEELSLTYVVLRLWDERRLILPVSHFTANPFENWTRHSSRVIGHVYFRVDWSVPVEELRAELYQALRAHPLWDQKDWTLQVTDTLPSGLLELRALMSAADSASAWDLKCDIREHMVTFIREKYPESLPRFRVDAEPSSPAVPGLFAGPDGVPGPGHRDGTPDLS
ncbi:small-conductance mechanosensitive channel [Streptosporangium becharense]|uniref:Small-conductance mechanosensitive channel n=1 Tax=Streptosporangium becharense TaxID=1816182 RepID=A0A7W9IL35_9ACTN|nr:mechanosensitive ion channel domain-containing protein [Streptosporangium becharense]MBB2911447.1 small-conductance mechanosensitive channel [Streptosporangium becharense]MBB5822735.1 small-conductance mechanosensitive channel [Streptosporangium becharense]